MTLVAFCYYLYYWIKRYVMLGDIATNAQQNSLPQRLAIYIPPHKAAHSKIPRWFIMPVSPISRAIQHSVPIDMTIPISINMTIAILHILHVEPLHIRPHLRIPRRRQQIHKKSQNIESENKRNSPFKNRRHVFLRRKRSRSEDDCQRNLDENEGQFRPETEAQDEMFSEMDS